jgi:citronellol/citronellal dehydrogenase
MTVDACFNLMFAQDLLKNKVVLVTGGRSGIGYNIAASALQYGAKVVIASRNDEKLQVALLELQKLGECHAFACDIREPEQVGLLADYIGEKCGRLDILINNAGGQFPSAAEDITPKGWNAVVNNNLNGTWYVTQTMANRFFIPQNEGVILSIIANIYRGFPGMVHTGAARAGVDNITKTLAVEWCHYGIRINAVAPGIIKSTGLEQYPPEIIKNIAETIPMKRVGTTQEVTDLCLFLVCPMASYVTGETMYVDGGQRLWGDIFKL